MNQGKLEVTREMARVNINILGISELEWTGMGELNSPISLHFSSLIPKMLMFTLAILLFDHFQFILICGPNIPGSYAILFLQHQILLPSPVTSTTGRCFRFGSISSFFLELFLHSSPVAYWSPTDLGISTFSVLSFCLFILFMGFSRQKY